LLLTIATTPDATRRYVEKVAAAEGVPLDALYGMLKVLGVDTGSNDLEAELREGAEKLKAFMAERPGGAATDPELVRLAGLAQSAQEEGAIDLALGYRAQASARADELSATLDKTEAKLEEDRIELGDTYAEHARTAELNFDFATAATAWGKAYGQVAKWDAETALSYKLSEAAAYLASGLHTGDGDALKASVATYTDAEALTRHGTDLWATTHLALGRAMDALGYFRQDTRMLRKAADVTTDVSDYYNDAGAPSYQAVADTLAAGGTVRVHLAEVAQDPETLNDAASAFAQAVELTDRTKNPIEWARAKANLGLALQMLGPVSDDPVGIGTQAVAAQRAALAELVREDGPLEWAKTQAALGRSLANLAQAEANEATVDDLTAAIEAFKAALEVQTRDRVPRDWSTAQSSMGLALATRGVATGNVDDLNLAVSALTAAREELRREQVPHDWAMATRNIALVEKRIADMGDDPAAYDAALQAFEDAASVLERAAAPVDWATTEVALGDAAVQRGKRSGARSDFELALKAYAAALPTYKKMGPQQLKLINDRIAAAKQALRG
jgi:hypothetical protein